MPKNDNPLTALRHAQRAASDAYKLTWGDINTPAGLESRINGLKKARESLESLLDAIALLERDINEAQRVNAIERFADALAKGKGK